MRQNVSKTIFVASVEPLMDGVPLHDEPLCISSMLIFTEGSSSRVAG
jgi:hypothetical protein